MSKRKRIRPHSTAYEVLRSNHLATKDELHRLKLDYERMRAAVAAAGEDLTIYVEAIRAACRLIDGIEQRSGYTVIGHMERAKLEAIRGLALFPEPKPLPKAGGSTPPAPGS